MYRVDRNNFYKREKIATVYTPRYISDFLFSLLNGHIRPGLVFDPCVGEGSLLKPWKAAGWRTVGIDIEDQGMPGTVVGNYLDMSDEKIARPALVIMNPPFNIDAKTRDFIKQHYPGRPLLPEIWLQRTLSLFGADVPIAMFTPYGFRLNQTDQSKRWKRFINGEYPDITSIVSLPKDAFEGVLFHSEVLIFNVPTLNGHYFVRQR